MQRIILEYILIACSCVVEEIVYFDLSDEIILLPVMDGQPITRYCIAICSPTLCLFPWGVQLSQSPFP